MQQLKTPYAAGEPAAPDVQLSQVDSVESYRSPLPIVKMKQS